MATTTRTKKTTAPASTTSAAPKKSLSKPAKVKAKSRAVVRDVEAGSSVDCSYCGERVKFQAKMRNKQVICNVYVGGSWNRVEHFHAECYVTAGEPNGHADAATDHRRAAANAASASPAPAAAPKSKSA
jgi:hypothetical protein